MKKLIGAGNNKPGITQMAAIAEQAEAFLTGVGLVGLTYSIEDNVLRIFYAEDGQAYNLTQYRSGYGWRFGTGDLLYRLAETLTHNGSFSFLKVQKTIRKELASIRGKLPEKFAGEEASFFMMQLRREACLLLSDWFPYAGRDLSWQQMLLFAEVDVPVDQIEEAKLLPDEWVRKMFTPNG